MKKMSELEDEEEEVMEDSQQPDRAFTPVPPSVDRSHSASIVPNTHPTSSIEDTWVCPYCEDSFETLKSLTGHVLGKSRHDEVHDYSEFRERYADQLAAEKKETKDTKSKKKTAVARGSSAVKLQPVEAEFDPAEAFEIKTLKKRTAILEEKLHQKGIEDKLGLPQVQEAQAQAMFDSQAREEDLLKSKDREIARLHEMREKEKDRAHEKEIAQIKNTHNIELKFKEMDYKFQIEMAKMKADMAKDVKNLAAEVDKTLVRGVNTFVDLVVDDYKHKKALRERDYEKLEQLHTQIAEEGGDGDGGILSMINPKFRRE